MSKGAHLRLSGLLTGAGACCCRDAISSRRILEGSPNGASRAASPAGGAMAALTLWEASGRQRTSSKGFTGVSLPREVTSKTEGPELLL